MARPEFQAFARELRGWIAAGVDLPDLIEAVEAYASAPTSDADARLVSHYLRLRETPGHEALLQAFETHYRNANCRVSISRDLIERLVPSLSRIASGISQEIEGVQVRGKNHGWTRFTVQLVPDDQRIRMNLLAHGEIRSRTVSSKGPVRLFNTGRSQFAAQKQLIIDADGLHVTRADADARSGLNLNDIETDFDGVPLLGWMVRQVAKQEHDDQQGMFRWRVQRRVAQSARHRLDQEFDGRISGAEDRLDQSILSPLRKLQLDPTSMELRTTTNRVVVRGRLSSETQLASYSPRPRALRDSLMSTQIHQSTINNLIDQLNVGGELRNIEELLTEIASKLGRDPQLPEDVPKNVLVRLAKRKPIRVDFDENRAMLTLNVAELRKGKRKWRNFVVRGYYRIDSHDKGLSMTRDQSIELISERLGFRDRLAVRAIFTKAMARNHELQLIANELSRNPRLSKLTITQLVSRDGWLGVSLGEPKMPLVANERIDGRR